MLATNTDEQNRALKLIMEGKNVLITAEAGTGKSYVINQILDPNTILVAPTGLAALNIKGATCHRTFGLPLGVPTADDFMKASRKMQDLFNVMSPVKRIIIDEVSMLRLDMFELINSKLQMVRGNNRPFGGIQVIVSGDYGQLDPIITAREEQIYYDQYKSPFNFDSPSFNFELVEFTKVFRQEDKRQSRMLSSIRNKDKYYKHALDTIIKESKPFVPSPDVTVLCCYKADVRKYNYKYFKKLDTPIFEFKARIGMNDDKWSDSAVPHTVSLREGARVMFKANDPDGEYVNGEKGIVSYVDNVVVKVKKTNGQEVLVKPFVWEKYEYKSKWGVLEKEVISTFSQIPLELAYATSIHSAQGQTLDEIAIDIGKGCFSSGQLYVALSRCRDLKNISFVTPPSYEDVILDKRVKEFYRSLRNGK